MRYTLGEHQKAPTAAVYASSVRSALVGYCFVGHIARLEPPPGGVFRGPVSRASPPKRPDKMHETSCMKRSRLVFRLFHSGSFRQSEPPHVLALCPDVVWRRWV